MEHSKHIQPAIEKEIHAVAISGRELIEIIRKHLIASGYPLPEDCQPDFIFKEAAPIGYQPEPYYEVAVKWEIWDRKSRRCTTHRRIRGAITIPSTLRRWVTACKGILRRG